MRGKTSSMKVAGMSDAAVHAKTGKTWGEWLAILDKAGARKWSHQEIVAYLHRRHVVGSWWQQMVTVGYEQARGLREKHQSAHGYGISASATIAAPVGALFHAWQDVAVRRRWLADPALTIRKATRNKSLRITWGDGETSVEVYFYPQGARKTQVNAQHRKLPDAKKAAKMKSYWKEQLERLKEMLEEKGQARGQ